VTLRHAKNGWLVLVFAVMASGSVVQAQQIVSGDENSNLQNSEGLTDSQVDSLPTEPMRKFLKKHRLELRETKSDLSAVVKDFREEVKIIKHEQSKTLKVIRKYKPPVLNQRKTLSSKKKNFRLSESSPDFEKSFPEQKTYEDRKTRSKEKLLTLNERQQRAVIESARREKNYRARNSELGRLKAGMEKDPLKSHQEKLTEFSDKIKKLMDSLQRPGSIERSVFIDLGNTHLESHRFLTSLSAKDRLKISRYASHSGTVLGSNESALWVFKMALNRNPKDAETNFTLAKILSEMGKWDLALRRARNAERLFVKNSQQDKAVQTRRFVESLKNTSAPL
jgi:hypothetical protein